MSVSRGNLVMGIVSCALLALFVAAIAHPGFRRLQHKRETIRATQSNVAAELSTVSRLAAVYAEVSRLSDEVRDFHSAIPADHGFAETYRTISAMLQEAGLSRRSIQPGRCGPLAEKFAADGPRMLHDVMVQPVTIQATGKTEGFVKFVGELEQWKRLNTIDQMRLTLERGQAGTVAGEFTILTYYLPQRNDRRMASADAGVEGASKQ